MGFVSAKRQTGTAGKSGQHTTAQVRSAGMAGRPTRKRSSSGLEIPQPKIVSFSVITGTTFDINVSYNNAQNIAVNTSKTFTVVTVNPEIPTPDQILNGQDATGALAVFSQSDITIEPLVVNVTGLTISTLYYVFIIVQVDPDEPKQGQYSIIAHGEQVT